jgi:hypothetical protein
LVRLQEPNLAIAKIFEERTVLLGAHLAGPDDGSGIDVSMIVNPLEIWVMIGRIPKQH